MTNKNSNKKDKKKLIVIALFLFAVISLGGYGVYSYFFTEGEFDGTSNQVSIASFDPRTSINSDSFLGDGGSVDISCPSYYTGTTNYECTGSISISNNGGTDIEVEVLDAGSGYTTHRVNENIAFDATASSPEFGWTTKRISAGSSEQLYITIPVTISSDFDSDSAVETNSPYNGGDWVSVTTSFKLKATQVH